MNIALYERRSTPVFLGDPYHRPKGRIHVCLSVLVALLVLCISLWLGSGELSAADNAPCYSGSTTSIESAASTAHDIFVGSVEKYSNIEAEGPLAHRITNIVVKVEKVLSGDCGDHVTVSLLVHYASPVYPKTEVDPKVGSSYMFFTKKIHDEFEVMKLMESNDDVIKKVETMIPVAQKK